MEGRTSIIDAYKIMGNNIIGPNEIILNASHVLDIKKIKTDIPPINYSKDLLFSNRESHTLILVIPFSNNLEKINIKFFKEYFGYNPEISEPCFYNQDWYLKEDFFFDTNLKYEWILIRNNINSESRGKLPILNDNLPTVLLCTYVFFISFICKKIILWENDYIWCNSYDSYGDQIYIGRYNDPTGLTKNGFSIHRHLSIKNNYGVITVI